MIRYEIEYVNEKIEKTLSISPIYILLCFIDSKVDSNLIPESWKTSKINENYVKIKFKNKKIIYLNKLNKTMSDKIPRKITASSYSNTIIPNANIPNNFSMNLVPNKEEKEEQNKFLYLNEFVFLTCTKSDCVKQYKF